MCRWHQKFLHTLIVTMLGSAFGACARGTHVFSMHKIGAVPSSAMHLTTIVPVAAKPGDEVTITGSGLSPQSVLRIGGQAVDFTSYSDTSAKFIMPTMPRSGAFGVTIGRYNEGTGTVDAAAKFMLADATDADYPIYMATAADICSPISFRDAQGDIRIGTKDCATGTVADCAADGAIGCKTVAAFPAANAAAAVAGNIKSGVSIGGISGSFVGSFSNCSTSGEQACITSGTYYAGEACAADGSACYLPLYASGTQNKKAIDFSTIDATKMLTTSSVSGVAGTIANQGFWALTASFPGAGYYTGVSSSPTAGTILSGTTITGVAGNVTLPTAENVYTGITFGAAGGLTTGTLTLPPAANVRSAVGTYGVGGNGVTASLVDCAADGATGCVTVASYKSADMSVAIPGNIKKDVTIAGTTGNYPSTASPLQLNTATVDLDGQFLTKLTSASAFEYFDSTGAVYAQAGDAGIISANIASGVTIFGTPGTITSPIAWDLRAGSSIVSPSGTVAGKLKVNCRNRVNLILQDMDFGRSVSGIASNILTTTAAHGLASNQTVRLHYLTAPSGAGNGYTYYVRYLTPTTFSLSTASGPGDEMAISAGTGITVHKWQDGTADIWDTIEDFNNSIVGSPTSVVSGWTNNDCGGKETVLDDANVWKDVTIATTNGGASCAANPSGSPENCTMKDKITGLWWSKLQAYGAWNAALSTCGNTLNTTIYGSNSAAGYNGQTGWRLPTQKELMEAYNHGVRSAATTNWMTEADMFTHFWSGSSTSNNSTTAWFVFLASGITNGDTFKTNTFRFVCVR